MVGMNAVIMDRVDLGAGSIVGALTFIKADTIIPERSLVVGNPGRVVKEVSDEMLAWKTKGTQLYQTLPADCHESLEATDPHEEMPEDRPRQEVLFNTWNEIKGN